MNSAADYLAAAFLIVLAIGFFLNVRNGTLGPWLKAKFLGLAPGQSAPQTVFTPAAA